MLHLHQSNRLETLAEQLADIIARPLRAPLQPETILVQTPGMARWLTLRLAQRLSICAHTEFPLPASFIWKLMRALLGELPRRSPFSPEVLAWRIMGWLGAPEHLETFPRVQHYLDGGGDYRCHALSCRIAEVLDQYLIYRPDWIKRWEQDEHCGLGDDEAWQAALWRDLAAQAGDAHWARLMETLFKRLEGAPPPGLPERVILFGISSLSPLFMELLQKLALHTEVLVFALNPSQEYWEWIRDHKEQIRLAAATPSGTPEELHLETGNPLLSSLGKQGRDFFGALAAFAELENHFIPSAANAADTLLHRLQDDILQLSDPNPKNPDFVPHALAENDRSLQIHACHSPMREMEVLHDQLLRLFADDPQLRPDEVAVLCTDVAQWTPYIEAVFSPLGSKPTIPFGIAGGGEREDTLVSTFLTLLDLPASRFNADWVLDLLAHPAVLRRFDLEEDDLQLIRHWVRETGIRWARDALHKRDLGLPPTARHTWRDGLARLLLGFALPREVVGDALPLFHGSLPWDDIEGQQAQRAGNLAEFAETLFDLAQTLQGSHLPARWSTLLNSLIERLFAPDQEEEERIRCLRDKLALLCELGEAANFQQPVDMAVIKSWLSGQLAQTSSSGKFGGGVTFAAMTALRGLPFKVICVLGLNDGAFPRRAAPAGFDLIAAHPLPGDRSRRHDDRYLFLEILLSARQVLYLSHVGQDIRDNSALPPSVLVAELLDTVEATCGALPVGRIVTRHFLQPFSPGYFANKASHPAFSRYWLEASRKLYQTQDAPLPPLFDTPLPPAEAEWHTLELEQLARFYRNPARALLQQRLGIRLEEGETEIAAREPFTLDYAARQSVRAQWLENIQSGRTPEAALQLAEAQGWLPHGAFGAHMLAREESGVKKLAAQWLAHQALPPLPFRFVAGEMRLHGWLKGVGTAGLVEYTLDEIKPRTRFALWLRHLALCHLRPPGIVLRSCLIGIDKTEYLGEVANPGEELAKLLAYYHRGLHTPLPFFIKSAWAYAEKIAANKDEDTALKAAHLQWDVPEYRNGNFRAESEERHYRMAYRDHAPLDADFQEIACALLLPLMRALQDGKT
jgi:exodeoxyribonuclease V gamma subunit